MNRLTVLLEIPKDAAETCCNAVGIEAGSAALQRASVKLAYEDNGLLVDISAQDLSSMRAALNTYLRWVGMCVDLTKKKK